MILTSVFATDSASASPRVSSARLIRRAVSLVGTLVLLVGCSTGGPATPTLAPRVIEVRPAHLAENVTPETNIVIRFEREVSEDWSEFSRVQFEPPVACDMQWHPERHTLTCEPKEFLQYDTTYTIQILGVEPDTESQSLSRMATDSATQTVTFSTHASDATFENPIITATQPADGTWDVRPTFQQVSIAFSEPMFVPSVESALSGTPIEFTPASGGDAQGIGCESFSWSSDLTQVTCAYASEAIGNYRLRLADGAMASNGKRVLSTSDVHWSMATPPNRDRTKWSGTYIDAIHGNYTVVARFATIGEQVYAYVQMQMTDGSGYWLDLNPGGLRMVFTPYEERLGGVLTGTIYNEGLICGSNHFDVRGHIRGNTWIGSLHHGDPDDRLCRYPWFSEGTFTLTPQ